MASEYNYEVIFPDLFVDMGAGVIAEITELHQQRTQEVRVFAKVTEAI